MTAVLEEAVRAALADPAPRLVLGDWLQQHGDPAGELVALHHDGDKGLADQYLRKHRDALLGALPNVPLTWFCGSIRTVRLLSPETRLAALKLLPTLTVGRFIEELQLELGPDEDPAPFLAELRHFACLRRLTVLQGAPATIDTLSPTLESLTLARVASLGLLAGPALKSLKLEVTGAAALEMLAIGTLPALESLTLTVSGVTAASFERLLAHRTTLRHLAISGGDCTDDICHALAKQPHAQQLKSLALTNGAMSMVGARALAAAQLRLEKLDVTNNQLEGAAKAVLMRLCTGVVFGTQRTEGEVAAAPRSLEGWVVLDRPKVDPDLPHKAAALLGKHHSVRLLGLETVEGVELVPGKPATVLRLRTLGQSELRLDDFAESLARRAEGLRRADRFRALALHLSARTAAYRLFDATGELAHAAGADAEVVAEGLAKLLHEPAPPDFLDRLRTRGVERRVLWEWKPVDVKAPPERLDGFVSAAAMDVDFDAPAPEPDEDMGVCTDCGEEAEVSECDDCHELFCWECLREPDNRSAFVCRGCEHKTDEYQPDE